MLVYLLFRYPYRDEHYVMGVFSSKGNAAEYLFARDPNVRYDEEHQLWEGEDSVFFVESRKVDGMVGSD